MQIVTFCHSIRSDWNHGNAHFVRGVLSELAALGHEVRVYEPEDGWSAENLRRDAGDAALDAYRSTYPSLEARLYASGADVRAMVQHADVVLVHEWTDPTLLRRLNELRRAGGRFVLLFHDTHHRMVSAPHEMAELELGAVDAVLAFGNTLRDAYRRRGGVRAYTWHEAADARHFAPRLGAPLEGDLVWIGNWGDDERTAELDEFLLGPVRELGLRATVYGVRYPDDALGRLAAAGIRYGGYLPNTQVPEVFARHRVTVHVPRRPYTKALPGIPTIRMFEALACGIPLVSAPWDDAEGLFHAGEDYLRVNDGAAMTRALRAVLTDSELATGLAELGRRTIVARHTCAHRAAELLGIVRELRATEQVVALGGAA